MVEAPPPAWVEAAPLGAVRWRLVCITRRGIGMTFASAGFWLAMAAVADFAGLDAGALALFFAVGGLVVYPAGWLLNRAMGGDLTARGSELRGIVGAITVGQMLGWPLVAALLLAEAPLVAFALAVMLGAHFLPYGWLYRAPAYHWLGLASAVVASLVQLFATADAHVLIPLAMALLYLLAGLAVWRQNTRERAC